MQFGIFEAKRFGHLSRQRGHISYVFLLWLVYEQVSRLSNPFDASISHVTIFGSQVLALSEDGGRMFIWEAANAGENFTRSSLVPSDTGTHRTAVYHPV
jgi:U3 small nucleolar RNA-associated protein 21